MLWANFGWNWLSGYGENFKISSMYFCYFVIISPWKKAGPYVCTNLNPLHQRMHCIKFGWNRLSCSGEEDFFNFVNAFLLFHNYLPLEKGGALHFHKLEYLSPKDALRQVWLKLAQWFWRRIWKCEKFTDGQMERQTDRRRTTGDQKCSLELTAQVS
mgnify:CR=1 FL=1